MVQVALLLNSVRLTGSPQGDEQVTLPYWTAKALSVRNRGTVALYPVCSDQKSKRAYTLLLLKGTLLPVGRHSNEIKPVLNHKATTLDMLFHVGRMRTIALGCSPVGTLGGTHSEP